MEKLEWSALEYEEKERSQDWFWALGIVVITSSIASMIYGNYFFAVLLLISGGLLGYFATRPPEMVYYELNDKGLKVRGRVYPYENIKSFWVQKENMELHHKPILFIKTERIFLPVVTAHTNAEVASQIEKIFLAKKIVAEEMQEHVSEKIMDYLGF